MTTYTLKNQALSIQVASVGGALRSLRTPDNTEYLWQGDPAFWSGQAPHLFPFVGRLMETRYTMDGTSYDLGLHGFFRDQELALQEQTETTLIQTLTADETTFPSFPRAFQITLTHRLVENTVEITFQVKNTGDKPMAFGYGGHPGFQVPLEEGLAFEDYCIDFGEPCHPLQVMMSDACLIQGEPVPYQLEEDRYLPLRHNLFDRDAVILKNFPTTVALRSRKGKRAVKVSIPGMPYVGFWHTTKAEAPFVCIEPWVSLPGRQDVIEDFGEKEDLVRVAPGETYTNKWTITVE